MRRLLTTALLVDILAGNRETLMLIAHFIDAGDELWALSTTRAEILSRSEADDEPTLHELFGAVRWLDVTPELADRAGSLMRPPTRGQGHGAALPDVLAAAGAEMLLAELVEPPDSPRWRE